MRHPLAGRELDPVVAGVEVRVIVDDVVLKPDDAAFRLYNVAVVGTGCAMVPFGPFGTLMVTGVYAVGGAAMFRDADLIAIRPVVVHLR